MCPSGQKGIIEALKAPLSFYIYPMKRLKGFHKYFESIDWEMEDERIPRGFLEDLRNVAVSAEVFDKGYKIVAVCVQDAGALFTVIHYEATSDNEDLYSSMDTYKGDLSDCKWTIKVSVPAMALVRAHIKMDDADPKALNAEAKQMTEDISRALAGMYPDMNIVVPKKKRKR